MITPESGVFDLTEVALENTEFRRFIQTNYFTQLVVMCLKPLQEIGMERHKVDQFFHIVSGDAEVHLRDGENETFFYDVKPGQAVMVAAGTWHNVVNKNDGSLLKLYTIYSPPEHVQDKNGVYS